MALFFHGLKRFFFRFLEVFQVQFPPCLGFLVFDAEWKEWFETKTVKLSLPFADKQVEQRKLTFASRFERRHYDWGGPAG